MKGMRHGSLHGQDDVDEKVGTAATLEEYTERWKDDGADDLFRPQRSSVPATILFGREDFTLRISPPVKAIVY